MLIVHIFYEIKNNITVYFNLQPLTELASHSEALGRSSELRFVNMVLDASMTRTHAVTLRMYLNEENLVPIKHKFSFTAVPLK